MSGSLESECAVILERLGAVAGCPRRAEAYTTGDVTGAYAIHKV
jgi:hypothetical protein